MDLRPKLDRLKQFDERSKDYPIRAVVSKKPRSYTWECNGYLDQGQEGACVGFSWSHELIAKPVPISGVTNGTAEKVYDLARKLDEYPGESYEGTSVLGGAKAITQQGYMSEYRWAFGLDDLILAVGYAGPAVLGIDWYEDMFEPDKKGLVSVTGDLAGGHAILCNGVNITKKQFRLHNSWGKSWGINGECFVSFADMDRLLKAEGEACIPVQRINKR